MEQIKSLLRAPVTKQDNRTQRGEMLKEFLSHITPSWDAKKYGRMTIGRLAKKLQGIPTEDLYYLHRVCLDSKDYSKRFFWELNPNKHTS
ncbi:hypothetical protein ACVWZV_002189 [Bradyrhizobium sp. GM5.1]